MYPKLVHLNPTTIDTKCTHAQTYISSLVFYGNENFNSTINIHEQYYVRLPPKNKSAPGFIFTADNKVASALDHLTRNMVLRCIITQTMYYYRITGRNMEQNEKVTGKKKRTLDSITIRFVWTFVLVDLIFFIF